MGLQTGKYNELLDKSVFYINMKWLDSRNVYVLLLPLSTTRASVAPILGAASTVGLILVGARKPRPYKKR